ncbi:hypothetical protein ACHAXR_002068 [Thalassiosira sp. AJA248-18]
MSGADSAPMSIADRIAALQNKGNEDAPPPLTKPKTNKNALAGRIAALQKNADSTTDGGDEGVSKIEKPKVGKLKPPAGAIPFGSGPPPSLLKKQKEREERMEKLQQEAKSAEKEQEAVRPKVGKLKLPAGAVPFGVGPPPSLLKKQKEREERMEKLQQEAKAAGDEHEAEKPKVGKLKLPAGAVPFGVGPPPSLLKKQKEREERMEKLQQEAEGIGVGESADVNVEDALLSRPTIKGKRRPRTRV